MQPCIDLRAPFPWFGGKATVASLVWERFGKVANYVEPFAGSLAVLLGNPDPPATETVNDADALLCNFWRALQSNPECVAFYADWPVSEVDLHARHLWLLNQRTDVERLIADPEWCDPKVAGWWVWGLCAWIGSGWCSGRGPWRLVDGALVKGADAGELDGVAVQLPHLGNAGMGVNRKLPHLGDGGRGVHRAPGIEMTRPHLGHRGNGVHRPGIAKQLPHLSDDGVGGHRPHQGIARQLPHLGDGGRGVNPIDPAPGISRQLPHLGNDGRGVAAPTRGDLYAYLGALAERLRRVRVTCGDWSRVVGPSVTTKHGLTAVFLDPPYAHEGRKDDLYSHDHDIAADVRAWAIERGDDPLLRIALCGYEGEHAMPAGWTAVRWKAKGGYGSQGEGRGRENAARECVWFSPHCLASQRLAQRPLPLGA